MRKFLPLSPSNLREGIMKVIRHQGAKPPKRLNPASPRLQHSVGSVLSNVGLRGGSRDRSLALGEPGRNPINEGVGGHVGDESAENCGLQVQTQISALLGIREPSYPSGMPYDPEKMRRAIRRVQRENKLKMSKWAEDAKIGERTISAFLKGSTVSPRVETIMRLADAAKVDPHEMLGLEPAPQGQGISPAAYRAMMALLDRIAKEQAGSGEALQSVRDLADAIARGLPRGP